MSDGHISLFVALLIPQSVGLKGQSTRPEDRAIAFLSREVPSWSVKNKCFSCHNNGDGARALYAAVRMGHSIPKKSLADTSDWLIYPERWDKIGDAAGSSDKNLARIQFAAALVDGLEAGVIKNREVLAKAAKLVAENQKPDGSWQVDAPGNVGSPATYGPCLATYLARRTLQKADPKRFKTAINKADRWFERVPVKNVLDATAVLQALSDISTTEATAQRKHCLDLIRKGESKNGGWGPYVNSPPEPFDTALVILALSHYAEDPGVKDMIKRGRAFLVKSQQEDGSWPETTRPAGAQSYAQRISTTAWATMALLKIKDEKLLK
ncbi:MAG TPA: hypothetical protein VGX70_19035 [Gemmataceae bacterium]|jgi:hypothetical protein|nr:hypothetical protein [Gemmataceae bacterium]